MTTAANGRTLWILRGACALIFLLAGGAKLAGHPFMVEEFARIGLGQGFRLFTGVVEVAGALLVLWPRTTFPAALGLLGVCAGAFAAQAGPLKGDLIHVLVVTAPVAATAWLSRPRAG